MTPAEAMNREARIRAAQLRQHRMEKFGRSLFQAVNYHRMWMDAPPEERLRWGEAAVYIYELGRSDERSSNPW